MFFKERKINNKLQMVKDHIITINNKKYKVSDYFKVFRSECKNGKKNEYFTFKVKEECVKDLLNTKFYGMLDARYATRNQHIYDKNNTRDYLDISDDYYQFRTCRETINDINSTYKVLHYSTDMADIVFQISPLIEEVEFVKQNYMNEIKTIKDKFVVVIDTDTNAKGRIFLWIRPMEVKGLIKNYVESDYIECKYFNEYNEYVIDCFKKYHTDFPDADINAKQPYIMVRCYTDWLKLKEKTDELAKLNKENKDVLDAILGKQKKSK